MIISIVRVSEHFSKMEYMYMYLIQEFWMLRITRTKITCVSITHL
jgi:hypothetical protein